jgi:hypothetical protein
MGDLLEFVGDEFPVVDLLEYVGYEAFYIL